MDRLDKRTQRLVKGSKVYKDGVGSISQHQMDFAEALEGFCGGTDEESLQLGKLAAALRLCPCCLAHQLHHRVSNSQGKRSPGFHHRLPIVLMPDA